MTDKKDVYLRDIRNSLKDIASSLKEMSDCLKKGYRSEIASGKFPCPIDKRYEEDQFVNVGPLDQSDYYDILNYLHEKGDN